MNAKFSSTSWSFAAALSIVPMICLAEAPPHEIAVISATPEMFQHTPITPLPTRNTTYRLPSDVEPQIIPRDAQQVVEKIPNACSNASGSLCYDYRTGHAVFKPMRSFLPPISGMTPHNLSLRRDKIVAQYTFK